MRMAMRRFTHLTNAFCKKLENRAPTVALYALWYNFVAFARACGCRLRWQQESKPGYGRWRMWFGWSSAAGIFGRARC